ncbi:DUF6538 domain-containing protein [Phenylobacterium sp.]
MHLVARDGRLYYRRRVPKALRGIVGRREIWRSLWKDRSLRCCPIFGRS